METNFLERLVESALTVGGQHHTNDDESDEHECAQHPQLKFGKHWQRPPHHTLHYERDYDDGAQHPQLKFGKHCQSPQHALNLRLSVPVASPENVEEPRQTAPQPCIASPVDESFGSHHTRVGLGCRRGNPHLRRNVIALARIDVTNRQQSHEN